MRHAVFLVSWPECGLHKHHLLCLWHPCWDRAPGSLVLGTEGQACPWRPVRGLEGPHEPVGRGLVGEGCR